VIGGPLGVIYESADEPGDGDFVGGDPDDLTASLDLAGEAFEWVCAV
jgi:hypothetical protein